MRTLSIRRPAVLLGVVVALVAATAAPALAVPPEVDTGQTGHYAIPDVSASPLVNCRYDQPATGGLKLDKFVAKPPKVWWPDTSDTPNQHGTVGWQVRVQEAPDPAAPWVLVYKSSVVKKTAFEDTPPLDEADKAPFVARGFPWSRSGTKLYRIVYVLFWYNGDGSVKGSLKHWIAEYKVTGDVSGGLSEYCPNRLFN